MTWAMPPVERNQLVLFETKLDDVIPEDHLVRFVDVILRGLDWSKFEQTYHGTLGARPVHPRVLASIIIYGQFTRVRSSRQMEAALWVRLDFKWLAEGFRIDHSTLSIFRTRFDTLLKGINTQFGIQAFQMGMTTLTQFGFDGTRIKASNARSRMVAVDELEELEQNLQQSFTEFQEQAAREDACDEEELGGASLHRVSAEDLKKVENRLAAVRKAQAEVARVKAAGEAVPERIGLTDPESRLSPNKEGGFAPNYTPLANVDLESGLILEGSVIQNTDEEQYLVSSIESLEASFAEAGFDLHVESMTADSKFVTGPNLASLAERNTTFYGPIDKQPEFVKRGDGSVPIPAEKWSELPTTVVRKAAKGEPAQVQLTKAAFVYDAATKSYWCPNGEQLKYAGKTSELRPGTERRLERERYESDPVKCAACLLKAKCFKGDGEKRSLSRDQFDEHRDALRERMTEPDSQEKQQVRQSEGERPFAVVKHQFGNRQFLLRGQEKVSAEWSWMTTAANLQVMVRLWRQYIVETGSAFIKPLRAKGARASPIEVGP